MSKVRLHSNEFVLSGYENIKVTSIEELDEVKKFDPGELDELLIDEVLDYLPITKVEDILSSLSRLIKVGGTIVVTGTDLYEVCKSFANYRINILEVNKSIFGENPDKPKHVGFSALAISNFLEHTAGLKIQKRRVNNFTYMIEATR